MRVIGARDILDLVEPRFGSAEIAGVWYDQTPLPGFGHKTAAQLVHDGRGEDVVKFIEAVDAGIQA